jgi:hypothetical protein
MSNYDPTKTISRARYGIQGSNDRQGSDQRVLAVASGGCHRYRSSDMWDYRTPVGWSNHERLAQSSQPATTVKFGAWVVPR